MSGAAARSARLLGTGWGAWPMHTPFVPLNDASERRHGVCPGARQLLAEGWGPRGIVVRALAGRVGGGPAHALNWRRADS